MAASVGGQADGQAGKTPLTPDIVFAQRATYEDWVPNSNLYIAAIHTFVRGFDFPEDAQSPADFFPHARALYSMLINSGAYACGNKPMQSSEFQATVPHDGRVVIETCPDVNGRPAAYRVIVESRYPRTELELVRMRDVSCVRDKAVHAAQMREYQSERRELRTAHEEAMKEFKKKVSLYKKECEKEDKIRAQAAKKKARMEKNAAGKRKKRKRRAPPAAQPPRKKARMEGGIEFEGSNDDQEAEAEEPEPEPEPEPEGEASEGGDAMDLDEEGAAAADEEEEEGEPPVYSMRAYRRAVETGKYPPVVGEVPKATERLAYLNDLVDQQRFVLPESMIGRILLMHHYESIGVADKFERMSAKDSNLIFGKNKPKKKHRAYKYLETLQWGRRYDDAFLPFGGRVLAVEDETADGIASETYIKKMAELLTVDMAFDLGAAKRYANRESSMLHSSLSLLYYYDDIEAVDPKKFDLPSFTRYPDLELVKVVRRSCTFAETLMSAPLPFVGTSFADNLLYTSDVAHLVDRRKQVIIALRRYSLDDGAENPVTAFCLAEHVALLRKALISLDKNASVDQILQDRENEGDGGGQLPFEDDASLVEWFNSNAMSTCRRLDAINAHYATCKYPRLLSPWTLTEKELDRIARGPLSRGIVLHPHLSVLLLNSPIAADTSARRRADGTFIAAYDCIQEEEEENAEEDKLYTECLKYMGTVGDAGSVNPEIVKLSDQLKLRVIALGKYAELEAERENMTDEEYVAARERLSREISKRSLKLFWAMKCESDALIAVRGALARILTRRSNLRFGPVANVNNNSFQTFMSWFVTMHVVPFKVAPRAQQTVLLLAIACKSHARLPDLKASVPLPNVAILGDKESSKSFAANLMSLIHLEGSVINADNISTQAFISGKNISHLIIVQHEGQLDAFIDPTEGVNSATDKQGNHSKASNFKSMMTEHTPSAMRLEKNEKTKKWETKLYISKTHNEHIFCFNNKFRDRTIESSSFSRMIMLQLKKPVKLDDGTPDPIASQIRPESIEQGDSLQELGLTLKIMHGLLVEVEHMLACKSRPGPDVEIFMATIFLNQVCDEMGKLGVDVKGGRKKDYVLGMARSLCIMEQIFKLLGTAEGHAFLDMTGYHPFSHDAIYEFIFPRLIVTVDHVAFILTLLSFQWQTSWDGDISMMFAHMAGVKESARPQHLVTTIGELGEDAKTFMQLGIHEPPPGYAQPLMTQVNPYGGGVIAPAGAQREGGLDTSQPVLDARYVVYEEKDMTKLVKKIGAEIQAVTKGQPRDEVIYEFFKSNKSRFVDSRYYGLVDDELRILEGAGTSKIPIVVDRVRPPRPNTNGMGRLGGRSHEKPARQFGIAIDYLLKYHNVPVVPSHQDEIMKELRINYGLRDEEDAEEIRDISNSIAKDVKERLRPIVVRSKDAKKESFIRRLSYADPSNAIIASIRKVLETPFLGIVRDMDTNERCYTDDEALYAARDILVYTHPRNFVLEVQDREGAKKSRRFMNMEHMMQLVKVTRRTEGHVTVICNESRARKVGKQMISTSLGRHVADEETEDCNTGATELLDFLSTVAMAVNADIDYISSEIAHRTNASAKIEEYYSSYALRLADDVECKALLPRVKTSLYAHNFNVPLLANGLFVATDFLYRRQTEGVQLQRYRKKYVLQYPQMDILQEIKEVASVEMERLMRRYKHVRSISDVLFPSAAAAKQKERMARSSPPRAGRMRPVAGALSAMDDLAQDVENSAPRRRILDESAMDLDADTASLLAEIRDL